MQNPDKQLEFGRTGIILLFLPFIFGIIPGLIFTVIAGYFLKRELKKSGYSIRDLLGQDGSNNRKVFLKDIKKRYNIKTYTDTEDSSKNKIDKDTEETHETIYGTKNTNESTTDPHFNSGKRITTIGITTLVIILLPLIVFGLITINNLGIDLTPIFLFLLLMVIIKYPKTIGTIVGTISLIYIVFFFISINENNTELTNDINNLFSGNSTRIRITLAILISFIIFKVAKAIIDSKKYNKDSFKS